VAVLMRASFITALDGFATVLSKFFKDIFRID
jgi:hypothetical protein